MNLSSTDLSKLSKNELLSLIERGIVKVMTTTDIDSISKEDLPEYQKHKHLAGIPIHISEGARKYDVSQVTISRWVKRGIIAVLGKDKNRTLIDEADLAYCAEIYKKRGKQGRWLFNDDGTPYIPTT